MTLEYFRTHPDAVASLHAAARRERADYVHCMLTRLLESLRLRSQPRHTLRTASCG